jgi:hypothetical protein
MSGFGDGYVGTAQDAVKIRRLEKQREAERRKIEELKSKNADGQPGLLQFGSSTSEVTSSQRHPQIDFAGDPNLPLFILLADWLTSMYVVLDLDT